VVLTALKSSPNGMVLWSCTAALCDKLDFILQILTVNRYHFRIASKRLQGDPAAVRVAMQIAPESILFATPELLAADADLATAYPDIKLKYDKECLEEAERAEEERYYSR